MATSSTLPGSSASRTVTLVAADDGLIENINVYPGRAELTRIFKAAVQDGVNHIDIHGLPVSLVDDSLRIDGHGWATICDVVVSQDDADRLSALSSSSNTTLKRQRKELEKKLAATQQTRRALVTYLETIKADNADFARLRAVFIDHDKLSEEMDTKILDLEGELAEVVKLIDAERSDTNANNAKQLTRKVSITVLAQRAGELTLHVKYLTHGANWTPIYDIQADTQATDKPLVLVYKAVITQSTYEFWQNAKLSLETVTPSLTISPPVLPPWHLWVRESRPQTQPHAAPTMIMPQPGMPPIIVRERARSTRSRYSSRSRSPARRYSYSRRHEASPPPRMEHLQVQATDNGGIMATFTVPGVVNLPSDGRQHNLTIAQLELPAQLIWYSIPSRDTRTYIKAKITNTSQYRLISGKTKTYIDGSFASTGRMPAVSPQETFDVSHGIDPGVKVTYHTREKKAAQTGIYSKSSNQAFIQRISIHNAKSVPVRDMKITDRIPISEDQRIDVRLLTPALTLPAPANAPEKGSTSSSILKLKPKGNVSDKVKVSSSIVAHWDGLGDDDVDQKALGKDGMVCWIVSLAPQERVTLVLQYEISHAEGLDVNGI